MRYSLDDANNEKKKMLVLENAMRMKQLEMLRNAYAERKVASEWVPKTSVMTKQSKYLKLQAKCIPATITSTFNLTPMRPVISLYHRVLVNRIFRSTAKNVLLKF